MELRKQIIEAVNLKQLILDDPLVFINLERCIDTLVMAYRNENKVLFCGNGGSAADAQHLAAELSGRYYFDRQPLNAEALHVNTSSLTAVSN
ncbi:MAG TPA: SIS domain-containing protein, partial [Bacteroidales bacterium]|nr:SIS domain-containing protein [Bacteroidales bacterium]